MQHTLIPLPDRKRLHREYVVRAATVLIFALSVSVLVGTIALFPAYVKALYYNRALQNDISSEEQLKLDDSLKKVKAELAADSRLLTALASSTVEIRFSRILTEVISARERVSITAFSVRQTDQRSVAITIKGIAPSRDDLLAFRSRLEKLMPDTTIDVPIAQLAKNVDPPFEWNFVKKIQ